MVDPPVQPDGNGGDDEGISVEESRGLCGDPAREVLQNKFVFFGGRGLASFGGCVSSHLDVGT